MHKKARKQFAEDKQTKDKDIEGHRGQPWPNGYSVGLVTRGCVFESRLRQELSMTEVRPLSKAPNPQLLQVCVHLDGLNAENTFHCW